MDIIWPNLKIDKFSEICRLCLASKELKPLAEEEKSTLTKLTPWISELETIVFFPNNICADCAKQLQQTNEFIDRCNTLAKSFHKCLEDYKECADKFGNFPSLETLLFPKKVKIEEVEQNDEATTVPFTQVLVPENIKMEFEALECAPEQTTSHFNNAEYIESTPDIPTVQWLQPPAIPDQNTRQMSERFDMYEFLEEYRRCACLWNKNCKDFKNRVKREKAEKVLLPMSGLTTIYELRRKIRNIRCTYNQEVAKIKKSMLSGFEDVYTPKLAWFALADSFLRQNIEENNLESNPGLGETSSQENLEEPTKKTKALSEESGYMSCKVPSNTPQTPKKKNPTTYKPKRKHRKTKFDDASKVKNIMNAVNQATTKAANEFIIFGQHVATQLQCLQLEEALKLQEDIQRLITSVRLRSLSASRSTFKTNSRITQASNTSNAPEKEINWIKRYEKTGTSKCFNNIDVLLQ